MSAIDPRRPWSTRASSRSERRGGAGRGRPDVSPPSDRVNRHDRDICPGTPSIHIPLYVTLLDVGRYRYACVTGIPTGHAAFFNSSRTPAVIPLSKSLRRSSCERNRARILDSRFCIRAAGHVVQRRGHTVCLGGRRSHNGCAAAIRPHPWRRSWADHSLWTGSLQRIRNSLVGSRRRVDGSSQGNRRAVPVDNAPAPRPSTGRARAGRRSPGGRAH